MLGDDGEALVVPVAFVGVLRGDETADLGGEGWVWEEVGHYVGDCGGPGRD